MMYTENTGLSGDVLQLVNFSVLFFIINVCSTQDFTPRPAKLLNIFANILGSQRGFELPFLGHISLCLLSKSEKNQLNFYFLATFLAHSDFSGSSVFLTLYCIRSLLSPFCI